jgi:hypothetical protein
MKKKQTEETTGVTIPAIAVNVARLTIRGTSPLLVHRFSEKARTEIEEKQTGRAKGKKAFRDKEQEFRDSLYIYESKNGKTTYGIPASGVKHCAVNACSFISDLTKVSARGSFHVIPGNNGLLPINGEPVMDESMVRIGGIRKIATPRYRGRFDDWECTFDVRYNSRVISAEQIANLYENAGFAIGLCEHRPEKNGSYGMFQVKR